MWFHILSLQAPISLGTVTLMHLEDCFKKFGNLQVGKLVRGVTVGHVERPGLVWIIAPPTEQSDQLLKEVLLDTFLNNPHVQLLVQVEMMSLEQWQGGEKPSVGTLVAVRFSEDGLVYRAKVTSFENQFSLKGSV